MMRGNVADSATGVRPGGVWLHVNSDLLDFHVTVGPEHRIDDLRFVLDSAERWGLTVLDQNECEPEILSGGRIRLYLKTIS